MPPEYEVNATFSVSDLIPFVGSTTNEANPPNLGSNPFQERMDDGKPLAKGPTTRDMAKHTKEEWTSSKMGGPKLLSSWPMLIANK